MPSPLHSALAQLLDRLEEIDGHFEELQDTICREKMHAAIVDGFVRKTPNYKLPDEFGMFTPDGNLAVKAALTEFILEANRVAELNNICAFHDRFAVFQDPRATSTSEEVSVDDFFGYDPPEKYDDIGNRIA